jgi:hypothetical protein
MEVVRIILLAQFLVYEFCFAGTCDGAGGTVTVNAPGGGTLYYTYSHAVVSGSYPSFSLSSTGVFSNCGTGDLAYATDPKSVTAAGTGLTTGNGVTDTIVTDTAAQTPTISV